VEGIAALSTGTKLMLASGTLLFFDLFLTWQNLPQRFGRKFQVVESLDGWDRVGLVLGLLTLALLALVILRQLDVELSPEVPWNWITLGLAGLVLAVATLKNVTDDHSAAAAYAGIVLAALLVAGAFLDRDRPPPEPKPVTSGEWKPRVRATPSVPSSNGPATREPEQRPTEPAPRW
jgi:hypothetical protein